MRYEGEKESSNVEDRRGQRGRGGFRFPFPRGGGGRGMRVPMPRGRSGGMSILMIVILIGLVTFCGLDPRVIMQGGAPPHMPFPQETTSPRTGPGGGVGLDIPGFPVPGQGRSAAPAGGAGQSPLGRGEVASTSDEMKKFVAVTLQYTEDVWNRIFARLGLDYSEPKLVLFTGYTQTRCGVGMAAMGPFYCPLDRKVYVDLAFYQELKQKFGVHGDFAQAYVIAHEVGHHVQTLLGIAEKVQKAKTRMSKKDGNALQVRMELQADCLAGVWARHADREKNILEPGDVEEAINAAGAIGDDHIQRKTQGRVVPDAFTHGTSKQRVRWFRQGYDTGDVQKCDTFRARNL